MNKAFFVLWTLAGVITMINGKVTLLDYFLVWLALMLTGLYNKWDREEREYEQTTKKRT